MIEEPELTQEELDIADAKKLAALPPDKIPDAVGLPDDVRDGRIED